MKRLLLVLLALMIIVLPCLASASEAISSNSNELSDLEKLQLQLQKVKQIYAGDTNSAEIHRSAGSGGAAHYPVSGYRRWPGGAGKL